MVQSNLNGFWEKADWPGNSTDLNPIENLWSILKDKINEKGQMTNRNQLIENLKFAWQDIAPEIFEHLVASMTDRIKTCDRIGRRLHK